MRDELRPEAKEDLSRRQFLITGAAAPGAQES
jgi:hypothetical protein